ncbi:MAG TPA: zinc ribbon domain-containing protein [Clostridiaceae bacterium]|nr:zinc ribbon domain-containing protein [Clostridiaceae bacterium]
MALIFCPECQNKISDRAEACTHCGLPSRCFGMSFAVSDINNNKDISAVVYDTRDKAGTTIA